MKIIATKTLNLIPIGNIRFAYKKNSRSKHTQVLVEELDIKCETDVEITKDQYNALMKLMAKSDLLTDGRNFYTTRGHMLTQINHKSFPAILEENKEIVHKLLYG